MSLIGRWTKTSWVRPLCAKSDRHIQFGPRLLIQPMSRGVITYGNPPNTPLAWCNLARGAAS